METLLIKENYLLFLMCFHGYSLLIPLKSQENIVSLLMNDRLLPLNNLKIYINNSLMWKAQERILKV